MAQPKIKIKGITLFPKQEEITKQILQSKARYIVLNASRQFSKSTIMEQALMFYALNTKSKLLYITPTYGLAKIVMSKLYGNLVASNVIHTFNKSDSYISFVNGSEIYFRSATSPDTIRGLAINYVFIDEAAFISDEAWNVIRPTLAVIGLKCIMASTPRGKDGFFFQHSQLGQTGDPQYLYLYGHYSDNPFYNKEDVEAAKQVLPLNVFKQEYDAEFLDDGGDVFAGLHEVPTIERFKGPASTGPYYIGVDLGRQGDYTVLTVLNRDREVIDILRVNKKDWAEIVGDIVRKVKQYPNNTTYVETNGIGDVVYDLIRKSLPFVRPFNTNNDSKNEIIENLIYAIQSRQITLPSKTLFQPLWQELETFSFKYSTHSRRILYGARTGFHDDCVMSLSIALHGAKRPVGLKYTISK